ncbi:hypothetical protein K504DRAFT_534895 [Pleomassaria siparia CBS 279.74]|uniref:Uncharacterized protein n=1 Tax=Pleomassaria siparia CBS 279.74 TaxID=1314801 RepID=A0A6G1K6L3_9PLEO|nr:hypothetical protein K504DRAFT_534895 [Pleomassaria siparia CBS 279.74]
MSGRLVGAAIATITGIATGVATFDGELKAQRKRRLEEEYNREVTALNGGIVPETVAVKAAEAVHSPSNAPEETPSKLSSILGIWAWKKKPSGSPPSNTSSPAPDDKTSPSR